ncbi:hypothetical protein NL528_22970 [Bradyrhizobium sp. Ash2021]|nr:hypothetical protein [Bradyrhizobium sp. Ash2021]WMT70977.1 hypothetical protein NL528_22970 [Bradyrhizobium sp. Ash2021]
MAKDPDNLARSFDTENTGGLLSGFLAEEDELDRHALWRIGSWGVGAVGAVIIAVLANQSSLGWRREQIAAVDLTRQAQQIQLVAKESQNETRRLASAIDTLSGDRDRLYSRVTSLEQGLDSVTGAIARQGPAPTSQAAPATSSTLAEPPTAAPSPVPAPAVAPVASTQPAAAPADKPSTVEKPLAVADTGGAMVSSVAKDPPKKTDTAKSDPAKSDPAKSDLAKSDLAKSDPAKIAPVKIEAAKTDTPKADSANTEAAKTDTAKTDPAKPPAATPSTPLVASKSIMAPPDPSATKLIEPMQPPSVVTAAPISEVVASAPPADDAEPDEATAPKVALHRTEFGVDLGSANSLAGLRALWRGLLKSRSNAPLAALRPIIVIKEGTNGLGMQLRLVAGPLNDAGAAARICAVLSENNRSCETAIFDGQRLSVNGDDPAPVSTTKPAPRRRGSGKHAAAVVEEPPKKPEPAATSTISSWFGKRGQ